MPGPNIKKPRETVISASIIDYIFSYLKLGTSNLIIVPRCFTLTLPGPGGGLN